MSVKAIGSSVITEEWKVVGATTTKTILVQSKEEDNSTACQFNLRLRYGIEGMETPIYSQETTTYLELNEAKLIDFRDLVPGDLQDSHPVGAWQIEAQLSYNFAPIRVRYYEIDLKDGDKAFYQGQLTSKADTNHVHDLGDINGVDSLVSGKMDLAVNLPVAGQILRAISPTEWEWANVQLGDGSSIQFPNQYVSTFNGQSGDIILNLPSLATSSSDGLISSNQFNLLSGNGATNGNVLQIVNNAPAWSPLVIPASVESWIVLNADTTLETGKNYLVKGGSSFTLSSLVSGVTRITNNRDVSISAIASGTSSLSGYSSIQQRAINGLPRVTIPPGASANFVGNNGTWECTNCAVPSQVFNYNFGGLADNPFNPLGSSNLFDYLGRRQGNGSWANPTNTAILTSASSANPVGGIAAFIDRNPTARGNVYGNGAGFWLGWRFVAPFRCTGFWIRVWNGSNQFPRAFSVLVNNVSSLSNGQSLAGWTTVKGFFNQTQINTASAIYYFSVEGAPRTNALVIQSSGNDSSGGNLFAVDQFALFGEYDE